MKNNIRRGFTLIELLVVVLIIGILAAIALPSYEQAVRIARTREAIVMLRSIAVAQEAYNLANGEYSAQISALDVSYPVVSYGASGEAGHGGIYVVRCLPPADWYNQTQICQAYPSGKYAHKGYPLFELTLSENKHPTGNNYVLPLGKLYCKVHSDHTGEERRQELNLCKRLGRPWTGWGESAFSDNADYAEGDVQFYVLD